MKANQQATEQTSSIFNKQAESKRSTCVNIIRNEYRWDKGAAGASMAPHSAAECHSVLSHVRAACNMRFVSQQDER